MVHLAFQPTTDSASAGMDTMPARVGFVIPRTVGCAVERNRVRRRLRHLAFERLGSLPLGASLVIRVLPGGASLTFAALGDRLDAAISAACKPRALSTKPGA